MAKLVPNVVPPPPAKARSTHPDDETIKETFITVVVAFVLAFAFRAYVVEAFVIPTGSMAPTLLGEHVKVDCSQCGYCFDIDAGRSNGRGMGSIAPCPMCFFPNSLQGARVSAGDRILVQKYLYSTPSLEPRRGDVVVFKAPHSPAENYIKRLVGLPNEAIQIIEGNVYVTPLLPDGRPDNAAWRIWRKTDENENPRAQRIQRAVWQPVYHSRFVPLDGGQNTAPDRGDPRFAWRVPWRVTAGQWEGLDDHQPKRRYRFDGAGRGEIRFDFRPFLDNGGGLYPYNHEAASDYNSPPQRLEDLRLAANVLPHAPMVNLQIRTQARIERDGRMQLTDLVGRLDADGAARIGWLDANGQFAQWAWAQTTPLVSEQVRNIELWFVDSELILWIDGQRVLSKAFDSSIDAVLAAWPIKQPPIAAIGAAGGPVTFSHVQVDRDLYYTVANDGDRRRGVIDKHEVNGQAKVPGLSGQAFLIQPDQFFCMGDNSPKSADSRMWNETNQWIRLRKFSNAAQVQDGVVPRRLMMGRAFFVYFPALYGVDKKNMKIIPNFGDMRFIH